MVRSLIRHSKIKPQDIIWSMPLPQAAKPLLFSLKNSNSSHFRVELSKICSLLLTFSLSRRKKYPQLHRKVISSCVCANAKVNM